MWAAALKVKAHPTRAALELRLVLPGDPADRSSIRYDDHDQLERHLADFVSAYNFGRRLKTLKGLTPYEFIRKRWTIEPERFKLDPLHQMSGLYTLAWALRRQARPVAFQRIQLGLSISMEKNAVTVRRVDSLDCIV